MRSTVRSSTEDRRSPRRKKRKPGEDAFAQAYQRVTDAIALEHRLLDAGYISENRDIRNAVVAKVRRDFRLKVEFIPKTDKYQF